MRRHLRLVPRLGPVAWASMALVLLGACRTTPLDNIWPGCAPCATAPATGPVVATAPARVVQPVGRVPARVEVDERVSPAVDCNPVRTQHTLVVTVFDSCGNPMPGQRVEWILARYPEAVGDIVAVDDQYGAGVIAPLANAIPSNAGNKIDNQYAVSVTNYGSELIDAANNHPYQGPNGARLPDITVGPGQSWVTITSSREGVTDLIVYVPAIRDGTKHKIFARKIWADYDVEFPADATNVLPEDEHTFPVRVFRTDGSGIPGQPVEAEVLDGPAAVFASSGDRVAQVLTNANGVAEVVLKNTTGQPGVNRVRLTAQGSFYGETCPRTRIVTKTWRKVALEVACSFPAGGLPSVGKPFDKTITVTNTGDAPATDVVLDDEPAPGLVFADTSPFPVQVGTLAPGATHTQTVRVMAHEAGSYVDTVRATSSAGGAKVENTCGVEVVAGQLEITKTCQPSRVNAGQTVTFVVLVSNTGRGPLDNVEVRDIYPDGIEPTSQDHVSLGTLAAGESKEVQFSGVAETPGEHVNHARAVADGVEEKEASCTVEVVTCRLEMDLTGPDQVYFNEPANFTLVVRNAGDGDAEGCVVRVTTGACLGNIVRDFEVGPLGPGKSWTQDFSVNGTAVGSCEVQASSDCGARCQIRRDVSLRVTGLPALQVEMVDKALDGSEQGVFRVGETFLYRLTVLNDIGTEVTPDLVVSWTLPPELEFVSGRSDKDAQVSGQGQTATSAAFSLGLKELITFDITVRVLSAPPSSLVKTTAVVARASDQMDLSNETESTSLRP